MNAAGSNEQKKVNGAMEVRSEVQKPLFLFSFFFFSWILVVPLKWCLSDQTEQQQTLQSSAAPFEGWGGRGQGGREEQTNEQTLWALGKSFAPSQIQFD